MTKMAVLIMLLLAMAGWPRTWDDNYSWCDPCKRATIKDGDTLRGNFSQAETSTVVCEGVKNLVVDGNTVNTVWDKSTVFIGQRPYNKYFCTNEKGNESLPLKHTCSKLCAHLQKTQIVEQKAIRDTVIKDGVPTITVTPAKTDTVRTYVSPVFQRKAVVEK